MKPFCFSLQSVRVLREQKERNAQQRFADAMRACEEQKRLDELGVQRSVAPGLSSASRRLGRERL